MKIRPMLFSAILLLSSLAWGSAGFGLKLGGVFSLIRVSKGTIQDLLQNSLSWQVGIQGSLSLADRLLLCPEIMLSHYQSSLDDEQGGLPIEWTFSQMELQLPLLLKWVLSAPGKELEPHLLLGPMLLYTLSNRFSLTMDGQDDGFEIGDQVNRFHYSLVLGAGVALPISAGRTKVSAEIRYNLGLKNQIADPNEGKYFKDSAVFLLGLHF